MNTLYNHYFSALLLTIMGLLVVCNLYTLIPLYQPISSEWRVPISRTVLASSFFSIFYAIGLLTFGPLSDKLGRKSILMYGILFSAFATFLVSLSVNIPQLYFFRALQGFALGCFAPVAFAYCFDHFSQSLRTITISLINAVFLLAGIVGPLVSEAIEFSYQWQTVYVLFGLIYLSLFFCCFYLLRPSPTTSAINQKVWQHFLYLLRRKELIICYMIVLSLLLSFVTFYDSLYQYLVKSYPDQSFLMVRSIGLIGTAAVLFSNLFYQAIGPRKLLFWCAFSCFFSFVLMRLAPIPIMIGSASILYVSAISLFLPCIISYIGLLGEKYRGSAISLYSFILLTGTSFGPIISYIFSFKMVLTILAIWFLFNCGLISLLKEKNT